MFEEIYEKGYLDFYDPDECIGDLGEKWCNFKWHIYNLQLHTKERIQSPLFTTRLLPDTRWYLEVKLLAPGNLQIIDITLNHLEEHKRIPLLLVDVIYKVISNEQIRISSKKTIQFSKELPYDSINTFSELFHKSKTNCLTIECKLRPNKTMIGKVYHHNVDETLPIRLRRRLLSSEDFDTIIRVGDYYRLRGHIDILQARLPHLLEKCLAPSKEGGKNIIDIDDLPVSVVKEMLKYAYTGQAYVDLESALISKDVLISYSKHFWKSCCWEDNPVAKTFFTYETDTLSWHLKDVYKKSNLGSQNVNLIRHFLSELTFSLVVEGTEEHGKWLMLRVEFLGQEMPKPTLVSCKYFLVNRKSNETLGLGETEDLLQFNETVTLELGEPETLLQSNETDTLELGEPQTLLQSNETDTLELGKTETLLQSNKTVTLELGETENSLQFNETDTLELGEPQTLLQSNEKDTLELGETETLLKANKTKGQLKLCPLLEVQKGQEIFRTTDNSLILQTDLKFCYGSYKSSIENVYDGKFDRSSCTSCPQLSADLADSYIAQNIL